MKTDIMDAALLLDAAGDELIAAARSAWRYQARYLEGMLDDALTEIDTLKLHSDEKLEKKCDELAFSETVRGTLADDLEGERDRHAATFRLYQEVSDRVCNLMQDNETLRRQAKQFADDAHHLRVRLEKAERGDMLGQRIISMLKNHFEVGDFLNALHEMDSKPSTSDFIAIIQLFGLENKGIAIELRDYYWPRT